MKKVFIYSIFALASVSFVGCKKWLDVGPENVVLEADALKTPEDMQKLLVSCYDVAGNVFDGRIQNLAELLSDNLTEPLNNLDLTSVYDREVTFFNNTTNGVYTDIYRGIFRCNSLLESFDLIEGLSAEDKLRIESEAKFLRALNHYWVLKIWSQPWGYTPDNSHMGIVLRESAAADPLPRSSVAQAYDFIISDLLYAYENLPDNNGNFANKMAAAGLLAQVLFQKNDYAGAANYASIVINSGQFTLEPTLDVFHAFSSEIGLEQNPEAVFQIVSTVNSSIIDVRNEGFRDNYWAGTAGSQLSYSQNLLNFFNLTPTDGRKNAWIAQANGQFQSLKFGSNDVQAYYFSIPLIRLSHLKLIRAEALASAGTDLTTAIEDVNDIRDRAFGEGLNNLESTATATQIINAARDEFRKETISEGYRIDQIRRLGALGLPMEVRGAPWDCPGMAIQFPNSEFSGSLFVGNEEGGCN
ncbi:MAG: RagB/SusD family nutrient uptake outer membrane protein [Flavobacteriales bacterium]